MQRTFLYANIHSCTLTAAHLNYVGSISIDRTLLDAAGILPYEQVQVVNIANGERLITYAIASPANSGAIELNGAAARRGMAGDRVIIMTCAQFDEQEITTYCPTVVLDDKYHKIAEVRRYVDLLAAV